MPTRVAVTRPLTLQAATGGSNNPGDGDARDSLAAADPPHPFVRFPLDAHRVGRDVQCGSNPKFHHLAMRRNSRPLGDDRDIYLVDDPSEGSNTADRGAEHLERVLALVRRIAIGKHLPDVARAGGAEDCIGDRVGDRVAVRVPLEMHVARNGNAAEDQWSRRREAVGVVADSDSNGWERGAHAAVLSSSGGRSNV